MDRLLLTKQLVDMMSMHRSYLPADRQEASNELEVVNAV